MAHFAELDNDNVVLRVIVVDNQHLLDENGNENEQLGITYCKSVFGFGTNWIQTSYNANFRARYAPIGGTYNKKFDIFIMPKPGDHYIFDKNIQDWVPDPEQHDPELLKLGIPYSALA